MLGARGFERQDDIGKFDVATARNFYHYRGWFDGSGRGASVKRKHGRPGYLKSVRNLRDIGIDESDVVSVGAPGGRIKIPVPTSLCQDPTIGEFHVQSCRKIGLRSVFL